ncbi:hypothetical protein D3C84_1260460 [compost metagenome]
MFAQVRVQRQRVTAEFSLVAFSRMADGPDKVADLAQYVVQTTRRQTAVMHDEKVDVRNRGNLASTIGAHADHSQW